MNTIKEESVKTLERTAFFRLRSPAKLAERLLIDLDELELLSLAESENFRQFACAETGRWIETPRPKVKRLQRRIHDLLTRSNRPLYLHSGFSCVSAVSNAAAHLENAASSFSKIDLRQYYPSSDGRRVFDFFFKRLQCTSDVASILFKLCTIRNTQNSRRSHLPTGGVTSPILAYFCYEEMFEELSCLAHTFEAGFSVLADDITFSGKRASSLVGPAMEIIKKHGLTCNYRKTRIWGRGQANKKITGCLITPKGLRVPKDRKDRISELKDAIRMEKNPKVRAKLWQRYHGSLASAGQIESRFAKGARCALQEWKKDIECWREHTSSSGSRHG